MQKNDIDLIDKMFAYNLWANTQLIKLCSELDDEQLTMAVEGVFGGIRPTLAHIIRAEGAYLNHLTGSRPWADDVDWDSMTMSDLLSMAQLSGKQLIAIANEADPAIQHDFERGGEQAHFFNWTVLLQALYHGIEHRTQIKILLTELGVTHPNFSVWDYTESLSTK